MSDKLPIDAYEKEIKEAVMAHQVVIVESPTGSGKTTRIPRFLLGIEGLSSLGMIGVTEPRKNATTWVAHFVATELGVEVGEEVGHQIRFNRRVGPQTKIKFMTDGILLREIQEDRFLRAYSAIVVDEAHERSQNIDFILGLLKSVLVKRLDLKVIVTSATIDTKKFSNFFDGAPVIKVPGRLYPVEVIYRPVTLPQDKQKWSETYTTAAARLVREIHQHQAKGDILVFMPGLDDINLTITTLEEMKLAGLEIFSAHSDMSAEDMNRIHEDYPGRRKVIVGTNILETSVTVDGLVYEIDSGFVKLAGYDTLLGLASLIRVEHSQMGCLQRTGRVGRTQAGYCYRLFSEANFLARQIHTLPEILRTELASVLLSMKSLGIHNVRKFDFVDSPDKVSLQIAHKTLARLGAIQLGGNLTTVGTLMAKLPVEPQSSAMIIAGDARGCLDEILTVVAFRSLGRLFHRPRGKEEQADKAKQQFVVQGSDYLTSLKVWNHFLVNHKSRIWARDHFLNYHLLCEVGLLREQLTKELIASGFEITSNPDPIQIAKCITVGLIENVCKRNGSKSFRYTNGTNGLYVFPGSVVWGSNPRMFVCNQIRNNGSKSYGVDCQAIKPEWLYEVASHLCTNVIEAGGITYDTAANAYTVTSKVHFDGLGRICSLETTSYPGDPDHQKLRRLYARDRSWESFLGAYPEILVFPGSSKDFDVGDPQVIIEADSSLEHPCIEVLGYPYVRQELHPDGSTKYLQGFTKYEPTATEHTRLAKKVWELSESPRANKVG